MLLQEINDYIKILDPSKQLNEKFVDIEVKMTLQQIINDGKVTNGAQTMVLVTLLELLQSGNIATASNLNDAPMLSAELVKYLNSLEDDQIVKLAQTLLDILEVKDADNDGKFVNPFADNELTVVDWVNQITKVQY